MNCWNANNLHDRACDVHYKQSKHQMCHMHLTEGNKPLIRNGSYFVRGQLT